MDQAEVVISVLNENDMNPVFSQEFYEFSVEWKQGARIGQVKVTWILYYMSVSNSEIQKTVM